MTFSATGTRNSLFDTGWVAWPQLGGRPHSSSEAQAELYSYVGDHQGDTAPCSVTHSRNYQISLLICIQSGLRHVVTIHNTRHVEIVWLGLTGSQAPSLLCSSRALLTADPTPDTILQMCAEFLQVMLPLAVRVPQRRREGTPGGGGIK